MANPIKGEVEFEAGGKDYILLLDFNALCELEAEVPGLMDGTAEIKSPSTIRAVFHAGLAAKHPEIDLRGAGDVIHSIGLDAAGDLVRRSFEASFPPAKGGKEASDPRKARAKAGTGSAP